MKKTVFLGLVLFAITIWQPRGVAVEESKLQPAEHIALGVLPAQHVVVQASVPKAQLWKALQGDFILPESFQVSDDKGAKFKAVSGEPKKGEYRVRLDGGVRFSKDDKGKRVSLSYDFSPRRIAILPVESDGNYQDAIPTTREAVANELVSKGLVVINEDEVADAFTKMKLSADTLSQGSYLLLAQQLNAAYLMILSVGANEKGLFEGMYSRAAGVTSATMWPRSVSATTTTTQVSTPIIGRYMRVGVGMLILTGNTGEISAQKTLADTERVHFRHFSKARKSALQKLATKLVASWRG